MVLMCPDRQIISLYYDNELPSPWKEKMAAHLESCPQCQAVLAGYRGLAEELAIPQGEIAGTAQERVWKKITAPKIVSGSYLGDGAEKPSRRFGVVKGALGRNITLPLPAAAAAALVIFAAFFALIGMRGGNEPSQQNPMAAMQIGIDDYGTLPVHDVNDVLQYLSVQDNADVMVIRLPEHRRFSRTGEPALINAADHSRTRRSFP